MVSFCLSLQPKGGVGILLRPGARPIKKLDMSGTYERMARVLLPIVKMVVDVKFMPPSQSGVSTILARQSYANPILSPVQRSSRGMLKQLLKIPKTVWFCSAVTIPFAKTGRLYDPALTPSGGIPASATTSSRVAIAGFRILTMVYTCSSSKCTD